jgi:hypothetical protein
VGDWYYVGHYGQLGPLTREQVDELVEGGVIAPDTYVWRPGMAQWQIAESVGELRDIFQKAIPFSAPPPPPFSDPRSAPPQQNYGRPPLATEGYSSMARYPQGGLAIRSDRSRTLGGILQLLVPGVGRIYLGYFAYGALQLVLTICSFGVLYIWSFIDGLIILGGGLKFDGFGRVLGD